MEAPALDTVLCAVSVLYDNPNASEKEYASNWLANVQKSKHSWKIANDLLQHKHNLKSCYFAAHTMRSKILHSFYELPVDAHASLRDSLIGHITHITPDTNAAITTQLCLAIADLALQMPSWKKCIGDLVAMFSAQNSWALLEILTVLPQEVDSTHLKLDEKRRQDIMNEVINNSPMVMSFLNKSMTNSTQNSQAVQKIIVCLSSWIYVKAIDMKKIHVNVVIRQCFNLLADYKTLAGLHEAATDCICALLHSIEEAENNKDVERFLFNTVAYLEKTYHMAVANKEQEKATNYSRVFTELAETFLLKIINAYEKRGGEHFALRSLDLVLICVGHHDYEVAEITFHLWYRLSEELYQRNKQELALVFRPYLERLVAVLARHLQMEPHQHRLLDESHESYDFRLKVLELIKDVMFISGPDCRFRPMFLTLQGQEQERLVLETVSEAEREAARVKALLVRAERRAAAMLHMTLAREKLLQQKFGQIDTENGIRVRAETERATLRGRLADSDLEVKNLKLKVSNLKEELHRLTSELACTCAQIDVCRRPLTKQKGTEDWVRRARGSAQLGQPPGGAVVGAAVSVTRHRADRDAASLPAD